MTMRSAIATADTRSGVERLDLRVALVAVSVAFYALTFIPLHAELGPGIVSLSVVPVALAGWLFGLRAGLVAGALAFPMNTLLLGVEQGADLNMVIWDGAVAGSAALMVGAVAGTLRDATERLPTEPVERHGTEDWLKESEKRMRHLVENAPGVLITVNRDGTVMYSNRSIAGTEAYAVRGTNVYNFVPRQHQDLFRNALYRVFQSGEPSGYEVTDSPPGGTPILHVLRFGAIKEDGEVVAATLLSLDISETSSRRLDYD